jgi:hypothetical protein
MHMRPTVIFLLTIFLMAGASSTKAQSASAQLLVGKWSWTMPKSGCVERHEYRADGTRAVQSGEERSETRYSVSGPTPKGFMKLTVTAIKDFGGIDCGGGTEDDSGKTFSVFFLLHRSGNAVLFCYEEALRDCYGPFDRMP